MNDEPSADLVPVRTAIEGLPGMVITRAFTLFGGGVLHVRFANGYGASIIRHRGSYGGDDGLFEVAVLGQDGELTFTTPITSDVIGYLSPEEVREVLLRIIALPKPE
jgi:hypothetical protein